MEIRMMFDFETAVEVLCALAARALELGQGIIPGRINQDLLQKLLGHDWQAGGSNQDMIGIYLSLD